MPVAVSTKLFPFFDARPRALLPDVAVFPPRTHQFHVFAAAPVSAVHHTDKYYDLLLMGVRRRFFGVGVTTYVRVWFS